MARRKPISPLTASTSTNPFGCCLRNGDVGAATMSSNKNPPQHACNARRRDLLAGSAALAGFGAFGHFAFAAEPAVKFELAGPVFEDLERRVFSYFWETADPNTGLVPDRWPLKTKI